MRLAADGFESPAARYRHDTAVIDWLIELVREKLAKRGSDRTFSTEDDLSEIGLSSLDMVGLMLRVEVEYDLQIPEADMTAENFRSVARIDHLVRTLLSKNGEAPA
jgi:acyl carrier protein